MNDGLLFAVLVVAIGLGWALGRYSRSAGADITSVAAPLPSQYYRGLNFLLDGSKDSAIDAFTRALEVNSETFDTHIALGNVLRRRGEVERATKIHQNLLARPSLPPEQLHLAHLELARDYISAGLFDRAERLLLDLVQESGSHRRVARRHLIEIYESQRDWAAAREVAEVLLPRKSLLGGATPVPDEVGQPVTVLLAHYCCEQAEVPLSQGDYVQARDLLDQALRFDRNCVRASMMMGELELQAGNPQAAVKSLRRVKDQDADFVADTVELLRAAHEARNDRASLRRYLEECFATRPSIALVMAIAEEVRATEGAEAAKLFLRRNLREKPSLRGLAMLMTLHSEQEAGEDESLQLEIIKRLVEARSHYRCSHCGFKGQHLHWYCPGCKHWGTVREMSTTGELIRG